MNSTFADTDPFSEVAGSYDATFTQLPSVALLRKRIHLLTRRFFPSGGTVLDLASGTGEDALLLTKRGFRVVGTDRSYGMLAEAAAKACSMPGTPQFVQVDAASLTMFRDSSFDAILSNFGGLNCVPDLRSTLLECHRLLRPNGTMVLCLLGAHSLWETAAFALRGAWSAALRRHSGAPVQVRVGEQTVDTWYYSIHSLRRKVETLFKIETIAALNVVAPPPASQAFINRYPGLCRFLFALDETFQSLPLLRACGDHTVLVLRRRAPA